MNKYVLYVLGLLAVLVAVFFYIVLINGRLINYPIRFLSHKDDYGNVFGAADSIETNTRFYRSGDLISVDLKFCKNTVLKGKWEWSLVDNVAIPFAPQEPDYPRGCQQVTMPIGKIPPMVEKNEVLRLEGTVTFVYNQFNIVKIPLKSIDIVVLSK